MRQALPLVTSCVTLWGMWLVGNKRSLGWTVGLVNQVLWVAFIVAFEAWGLAPLTVALVVIYTRNLLKWRAEAAQRAESERLARIKSAVGCAG